MTTLVVMGGGDFAKSAGIVKISPFGTNIARQCFLSVLITAPFEAVKMPWKTKVCRKRKSPHTFHSREL